jgi:hypothetical protein
MNPRSRLTKVERWKRYALPLSPHPQLRLLINKNSHATLTMNLVQKIGLTSKTFAERWKGFISPVSVAAADPWTL